MNSFPIWVRLTAWCFLVLAVILSLFGLIAYSATRSSIHRTVDEELRTRTEGARRPIERTPRNGDVQGELRERSELAGGALLQIPDQQSNWRDRSARKSMGRSTFELLRVGGDWSWVDETA